MLDALGRMGLLSYFAEVIGQDNIYAAGKLDSVRRFAARNSARSPVVIGDTMHDFEMARSLGADCILYTGGHCSTDELRTARVPLVSDLRDAAALILEE